jgi:hypothetical protein
LSVVCFVSGSASTLPSQTAEIKKQPAPLLLWFIDKSVFGKFYQNPLS